MSQKGSQEFLLPILGFLDTCVLLFVLFIIFVGYLLVQMYRIGVSENFGIVRSIVITIIALVITCILLVVFAALSVILPNEFNPRVIVFLFIVLVANVETNGYVFFFHNYQH